MVSRVAGLVRDKTCSYFLGVGTEWSAFWIGFQFPNLFRRIFGEGALTAVVVPAYTRLLHQKGQAEANRLASATLSLLAIVLLAITVIGECIVLPIAFSENVLPANRLAAFMVAVMLPYAITICLVAIMSAIATVHERFVAQSLSPIVLNVAITVGAALGTWVMTTKSPLSERIWWVACSVLVAGVLQVLMLVPTLQTAGVRVRPTLAFKGSGIGEVIRPMLPMVIGLAAVQFNTFLDSQIAWWFSPDGHGGASTFMMWGHELTAPMQAGAVGKLSIAQRIYLLPVGIFGVAMATAIFPLLARAAADNNTDELKRLLVAGLKKTLFLSLPASVGMILIAKPLITLIYLGGKVTPDDVNRAWWATVFFCGGIWAFEAQMVLLRVFYVMKDPITPMKVALGAVAVNICLNLTLIWFLQEGGIALSTTVAAVLQIVLLLIILRRRLGVLGLRGLAGNFAKGSFATILMVAVGAAVSLVPLPWDGVAHPTTLDRWLTAAVRLPLIVVACGMTYLVLARLMGMAELRDVPFIGRRLMPRG